MKRQSEYDQIRDAISKSQNPFEDNSKLKAQQVTLGAFKVGDRVRYNGEITEVASVDNFGHTLKYTLYRMGKHGLPNKNKRIWHVDEEGLSTN